ncbi:hypothetical protein MKD41_01125 [Lutibacter sp. A64]|uniref:hypothetical protein n=1 Tax=Lutibacter sp. A64 TaxID=2918526 RepID=UPI001F0572F6|nr:hypothetical protein [Lutibacter sp. A64]UMB54094.1 hypothetical protein MKD41_01125 [Lutibacter sp. A64]
MDSLIKAGNFHEKYFDTIFEGNLKLNVFETEKQKLSFITGAYVRYGGHIDSLYHLRVFNSSSKVRVLDELLKDVGCTNVVYDIKKTIPMGHTVSFISTVPLINYFEKYKKLK